MKRIIFLFILASAILNAQDKLLRFPSLNDDGSLIAFSYQGDIWTAPSAGGQAIRLTVHEGYESHPVFSPDGKFISFSGERYGNDDIFIIPSTGGEPERLTYHSANDNISSFTKDGKILFNTYREFRKIERPPEIYIISKDGGTEKRILGAQGYEPSLSPNGKLLAFVRADINPVERLEYRGPSNREIWIYNFDNDKYTKLKLFETNDIQPRWKDDNTLYFLSSESGQYNIYKITLDENGSQSSQPEKITNFKDHSIRHFNISGDGNFIVFEQNKSIYLLDTKTNDFREVDIEIAADYRYDPVVFKTFSKDATEYAVSPNGKLMAYVVRGEIFLKENNKEDSKSVNLSNSPFNDKGLAWLSDTALIFTSDREDNNFELYLIKSSDPNESDLFKTLKRKIIRLTNTKEDEAEPVISNKQNKIAYILEGEKKKLITASIDGDGKLNDRITLHDGWAKPHGVCWSPDDNWLAYSMDDLYFNEEVFIQAADNSSPAVNVSMHPRSDFSPHWSKDGSILAFISERHNRDDDVWFVWLKKSDWEKTQEDWEEEEDSSKNKKSNSDIKIDFENIHERLVRVTDFPGDEDDVVISADGKTFYYTAENTSSKGRDIYSIKWNGKDIKELTNSGINPYALKLDNNYKYLYYGKKDGTLGRIELKSSKNESLPFKSEMFIDYPGEKEQIFEEAWRALRDNFYDPDFHGKNWRALKNKYKDLCLAASTNYDFRDMFNLMLGELNSSHMEFRNRDIAETQEDETGLLGAELFPVEDCMLVNHVIAGSPADKNESKLYEGDIITAVNGIKVDAKTNFYKYFNKTADEKVLLTVKDNAGKTREVVIRPVKSLRDLLYKEWVDSRKKLTEQYSKGRLGYIHIQGMNIPSLEVFERELTAAGYGKEGLVIDVRYNGGGFTTDLLMTILNYKQHAYTIPRGAAKHLEKEKKKFRDYYPIGERLVFAAWLKPSVALCNEGSYSNAEIFSHAYKNLGIGTLVGYPTNGSVISTGARTLIDGSYVRLPFRGWFVKATDKNQELGPAIPDIIVENPPDWLEKGDDPQLKKAVEVLLDQIDDKKN